jgi:hypothetical protein
MIHLQVRKMITSMVEHVQVASACGSQKGVSLAVPIAVLKCPTA